MDSVTRVDSHAEKVGLDTSVRGMVARGTIRKIAEYTISHRS